ncbi:MAG: cell division protein FtsZ, partial [Parvibaculales bacterium]
MSIKLGVPSKRELRPRLVVMGVGGAGGNAINNMIESGLSGVEFIAANTDAQVLSLNKAERKLQIGMETTQGLGAGSDPAIGAEAAEESTEEIKDHLSGAHMLFLAAGMGGGTGTGATPVIARIAREAGILTVGVVTMPFDFEGERRKRLAKPGIEELAKYVDTLIIIPNQNLFRISDETTTFEAAFCQADNVLNSGIASITDLMVNPGFINLDFADVRSVMQDMGKAMMGTGEAEGEGRAVEAAKDAISNPLLDDVSLSSAKGILISIMGAKNDLKLHEVNEAVECVTREAKGADVKIIFGTIFDDSLEGRLRVSVVATGLDSAEIIMLSSAQMPENTTRKPDTPLPKDGSLFTGELEVDGSGAKKPSGLLSSLFALFGKAPKEEEQESATPEKDEKAEKPAPRKLAPFHAIKVQNKPEPKTEAEAPQAAKPLMAKPPVAKPPVAKPSMVKPPVAKPPVT